MLTQTEFKSRFKYDPDTGLFTRIKCFHSRYIGEAVGCIDKDGYLIINISKKLYKAHRLAFLYMTGSFPASTVDHIDRNKINNKWENLRDVSMSVNKQNMVNARKGNSTGFLGVSFCNTYKKFVAGIKVNGKRKQIGYYATPELAHTAYLATKKVLHAQ